MTLKARLIVVLAVVAMTIGGCKYDFSGYDIDGSTAVVKYFQNQAPIQAADLSQVFTNKLESKIIRDTPLQLSQGSGDMEFSGIITGYTIRPIAIRNGETTEQSELTLTVQVEYKNFLDDSKDFRQSFNGSAQFDATLDIISVEEDLLDEITDQLIEAVFNRAFVNW